MSRCFPYPPPGFEKRAALIETIKLQKEKAKKEKKKEKKREKREHSGRDAGKKEEKEHNQKKRKYEEFSQSNNKSGSYSKTREDEFSQLERSSLTEERGPAVVLNLCDSSDSTQNSSKRRKDESAEVTHTLHGVGLRIRLPLLRQRDSAPPVSTEQPCFSGKIGTAVVPAQQETRAGGCPKLPPTQQETRANNAHLKKLPSSTVQQKPRFSGKIEALPTQQGTRADAALLKNLRSSTGQQPRFSGKIATVVSSQQEARAGGRPIFLPCSTEQQPSFSRKIEAVPDQQETGAHGHRNLLLPSVESPCIPGRIDETVVTAPRANGHPELPSSSTEQPCFSGRTDATPAEELAKVSHGRRASAEAGRACSCGCGCDTEERRQYNNLMRNWNPPPLQVEYLEDDDQDWLFGTTSRRQRGGEGEISPQAAASKDVDLGDALISWPPRACYLPDVGIHALPYVVPF